MKVGIFNGTVATTNGLYRVSDLSVSEAKKLLCENGYVSAIGHESTAKIISELMEMDIQMNRINFEQMVNQKAVVFKLNKRPEEGTVLTRAQVEEVGYSFKLMERLE
ncbi:MAG TPA: YddF family protein [Epulopiscium sp.]|nr:YddF family protein [Candidatus Epulonipiscium sp.]